MPADAAVFGFGEHTPRAGLRMPRDGLPITLWNRDIPCANAVRLRTAPCQHQTSTRLAQATWRQQPVRGNAKSQLLSTALLHLPSC